jgi:hypothetical protein
MAELPAELGYRQTEFPGFWSVVRDLLRNARHVSQVRRAKGTSVADEWYRRRELLLAERFGNRGHTAGGDRRLSYDEPLMPDESLACDLAAAREVQTAS